MKISKVRPMEEVYSINIVVELVISLAHPTDQQRKDENQS